MGKMSRDKGKRGEREVVALIKSYGFGARRGQQFKGTNDSPDVLHDIPGVYLEVKFRENFSMNAALNKVCVDAQIGELPVVFHRRLHEPWRVTADAREFLQERKEMHDDT